MEIILFTVVGIVLYVITGQLLAMLEKIHGDPVPQRNIVFFVIILALSLPSFSLLRSLLGPDEGPQHDYEEQHAPNGGNKPPESH